MLTLILELTTGKQSFLTHMCYRVSGLPSLWVFGVSVNVHCMLFYFVRACLRNCHLIGCGSLVVIVKDFKAHHSINFFVVYLSGAADAERSFCFNWGDNVGRSQTSAL